jgi:uncharacterized protein (TIGR02646 family)
MRTIHKGGEPPIFTAWKRANPHESYQQLTNDIRRAIRQSAIEEQFYLCAYCCQQVQNIEVCHNEHLESQHLHPNRSVDFTNIVASCNTFNQCGKAHEAQSLPLTPLMKECETELRFKISGRVEGLTPRAKATIQSLNLGDHERNNRSLIEKRKKLSDALLLVNGLSHDDELKVEDEDILEAVIQDLLDPQQGKLEPFAPVVVNLLRNWLSS